MSTTFLSSTRLSFWPRLAATSALAVLLAGCSTPPGTISLPSALVPPPTSAPTASDASGLATTTPIKWSRAKPGCEGPCPRIEVDSIAFPGDPALTKLIDFVLAYMTGVGQGRSAPYQTIDEYTSYFWQTAQPRDITQFKAQVKAVMPKTIALELYTDQHLTGAAHGIPATQYLNWQVARHRVLALDDALLPGRKPAFMEALRQAHGAWLASNAEALRDPARFKRMWPFQESDNFVLTPQGVVVKYDAYSIAPYSSGQPEITMPYAALSGILSPEWMPTE